MGIFEDTMYKAKEAFGAAAAKSGEVLAIQKLRFKISSTNSQINKQFEALGKIVYENAKNEDEDNKTLFDSILNEIDAKYVELDELLTELAAARKIKTCASCGKDNSAESDFCGKCGSAI